MKKTDILGYSALIDLGSGYLLLRSSGKARNPRAGLLDSGLGVGLISCILGTIVISASYESTDESKKAIDILSGPALGVSITWNFAKFH